MAKEMIVSVNGREKKIAILEDGKVTEFYIERGEENSGVVGNIYKGRVQRVLPGMQSAFVEIGLERDAFLYVSDFFDEEEEFERIVMEKAKKGDVSTAEKQAADKLQRARLEREQAMEAAQERAEPILAGVEEIETIPDEFEVPEDIFVELEGEIIGAAPEVDDEETEEENADFELIENPRSQIPQISRTNDTDDLLTPFVADDNAFERIVDDEDNQAEPGDLFKEARIQERIADQVRAVEFEIEPSTSMEVGSLRLDSGNGGLQRIDDGEDEIPTSQSFDRASGDEQEKTSKRGGRGKRGRKKGETEQPEQTPERPESRVESTETASEIEQPAGERRGKRGGRKKESTAEEKPEGSRQKRGGNKRERKLDGAKMQNDQLNEPENQPNEPSSPESVEDSSQQNQAVESESTATRDSSSVESTASSTRTNDTDTEGAAMQFGEDSGVSSPADAMISDYEDSDASVDDFGLSRSEFAVRRGGRRRRGGRPGGGRDGQGNAGEEQTESGEAEEKIEGDVVSIEETPEIPVSAPRHSGNGRSGHQQREPRAERPERNDRGGRNDRNERNERNERHEKSDRNDRGDRGGRRTPTITDLLREGQEILVQIAKEPIAKKGARITSHIALPGRYLVYMPTIEHVGVSRKIESGNERNRLRTLIQKIRNEEDVPSGGFIVRTAGIGIPEQNLREDARYLVRTWLDIRKQAEKSKSPSLVHQDLDLVERILRDQLSDDFAAIRVDDEDEYMRVVEFINRMSPRMTNRVKLYTREDPIMETYGVQEEIDKAVKPRVWLKSGGYLVINQTEALVSIDVNTGKFVGKGANRLEDTITKTNMEAVEEIARQIRLRDLGGIIVLDLIDMEDKRNRQRVLQTLQEALQGDKSPTKVLSFNDFGLIVMTRKRVKQSLERTLCAPCHYCQGAGLIKSAQTVCYEILAEARRLSKGLDDGIKQTTLRVHSEIAKALRTTESDVLTEIEEYLGAVDLTTDASIHQEQFDFAFI